MNDHFARAVAVAVMALWSLSTYAQDVSVGELKSKGATVLSAEELKVFLAGTNLRYENRRFITQLNLKPDGSLDGSSQERIGGSYAVTYSGHWKVTPEGHWCGILQRRGATVAEYCREVLRLADKYYYSEVGKSTDARAAVEMNVSK